MNWFSLDDGRRWLMPSHGISGSSILFPYQKVKEQEGRGLLAIFCFFQFPFLLPDFCLSQSRRAWWFLWELLLFFSHGHSSIPALFLFNSSWGNVWSARPNSILTPGLYILQKSEHWPWWLCGPWSLPSGNWGWEILSHWEALILLYLKPPVLP